MSPHPTSAHGALLNRAPPLLLVINQVGVELVERTGRSPHYVYQSLGCSKAAADRMLRFAKTHCVGKPFSNTGMARSLLWPRQSDYSSFFCAGAFIAMSQLFVLRLLLSIVNACHALCAELVAAILREGGLLEASSNPGSATPETLHRVYQTRAAATANPYVLRDLSVTTTGLSFSNTVGVGHAAVAGGTAEEREALLVHSATTAPIPPAASNRVIRWRDDSPPRGHFRIISSIGATRGAYANPPSGHTSVLVGGGSSGHTGRAVRAAAEAAAASEPPVRRGSRTGLNLTLRSLDMRATSHN